MQNANEQTRPVQVGYPISGVIAILGISRTAFYTLRRNKRFPEPCYCVGKRGLWTKAAIDAWIREQR